MRTIAGPHTTHEERTKIDNAVLRELRYLCKLKTFPEGVFRAQIHFRYPEDVPHGIELIRSLDRLKRRGLAQSTRTAPQPARWRPTS